MATKAELQARVAELEAEVAELRHGSDARQCLEWLDQVPSVTKVWGSVHSRWIWDTPWGLFQSDANGMPPAELVEEWRRRRQA